MRYLDFGFGRSHSFVTTIGMDTSDLFGHGVGRLASPTARRIMNLLNGLSSDPWLIDGLR